MPASSLRSHSPDGASTDLWWQHQVAAYSSFIDPERMKGWVSNSWLCCTLCDQMSTNSVGSFSSVACLLHGTVQTSEYQFCRLIFICGMFVAWHSANLWILLRLASCWSDVREICRRLVTYQTLTSNPKITCCLSANLIQSPLKKILK